MKKTAFVLALLLGVAGSVLAGTGSTPAVVNYDGNSWGDQNDRATVLLIETTTTAIGRAITDCGQAYDQYYYGGSFPDLTGYDHVFLAMDGGTPTNADIVQAAAYVNGGGKFHIYGGTCWYDYALAMNNNLIQNDVNNYCWQTVYGSPHVTVVDASHYLAQGLPATYNWADISASYYQLRMTDGALAIAAVNGDGWPMLASKDLGGGVVDICIDSSYDYYYSNPNDYSWLKTVVCNMLAGGGPTATETTSWGAVKALYR